VPGLLHPSEKDHLERRQDRRDALLERPLGVLEHRRDRRAVRRRVEPLEDGCELPVDLRRDGLGDLPLRRVVLEVDRPFGEAVEPAPKRVCVEMPEAEHASEPEHGHRFEVLAHQLRLGPSGEAVEKPRDERLDQVRRRRLDDARAKRRVEHRPEPFLRLAVEQEDAVAAHGPLER
jgi:hypothetical protein